MNRYKNIVNPDAENSPLGVKKNKLRGRIYALLVAVLLFGAGILYAWISADQGLKDLLWFKEMIQDEYYGEMSDEQFWQAAIDGVEAKLDDYSCFYTADEYRSVTSSRQGNMVGTGFSFFSDSNLLYHVAIGSPAFLAENEKGEKIEAGMFLTGVGAKKGEYQNTFDSKSLLTELGKYKSGDEIFLRLSSESSSATEDCLELSIKAGAYTESFVLYATKEAKYAPIYSQGGWVQCGTGMNGIDEDTAYIQLVRFYGNAAAEFAAAARQFLKDGKTKLVLDLRNNGGGDMEVLRGIASYLMKGAEKGDVVAIAKSKKDKEVFRTKGGYFEEYFGDSKVYVIANRNSASASEALMGAMLCSGTTSLEQTYLVTTDPAEGAEARTFGKGIMQTTYENPFTGTAVKLTTAYIYWPDGETCIHGKGISTKDGAIGKYSETNAVYKDPVLKEILSEI